MDSRFDWQSIQLPEDVDYDRLYEHLNDRPQELEQLVNKYLKTDQRWLEYERRIQEVKQKSLKVIKELKQINETNEKLAEEVIHLNDNPKTTTISETIFCDNEYTYYSEPIQRVIDIEELRQRAKDLGTSRDESNAQIQDNSLTSSQEVQTSDENFELSVIYDGIKTNEQMFDLKCIKRFERILPKIGDEVFAASNGIQIHCWRPATVIKIINLWNVSVVFADRSIIGGNFLSHRLIAYNKNVNSLLNVGERVVAYFNRIESPFESRELFSGTVAEPAKHTNGYRYLIFFDKLDYRYVKREDIYLIYEKSNVDNIFDERDKVSNNEIKEFSEFLKNYIRSYPERPMLRLQKGDDRIKVRFDNKWEMAKVIDIDASLALIQFPKLEVSHSEWIYRGSRRLFDIFKECQYSGSAHKHRAGKSTTRMTRGLDERSSQAFVEWNNEDDDKENESTAKHTDRESDDEIKILSKEEATRKRKVKQTARKSTAKSPAMPSRDNWMDHIDNELFNLKELPVEQMPETDLKPKEYLFHECSNDCINFNAETQDFRDKNPFHIPIFVGFRREILKTSDNKTRILYRGPCGRRLRDLNEVYQYLQITESILDIDLFTFQPYFQLYRKSEPLKTHFYIQDITTGLERQPISCVNTVDKTDLGNVVYKADRFPHPDVNFKLDPEFLSCCDCTDNCMDSENCSCQRLTLEASDAVRMNRNQLFAYNYKRLDNFIMTGVFECNQRCQCNERCQNRVVQNGIKCRLQLFKTLKKGWGVRVLHDVPKGAFLCIYAAEILNEETADARECGDEYLADLDYIDVCERQKEGYESDVESDSESDENFKESEDSSNDDEDYKWTGDKRVFDKYNDIHNKNIISGRRRAEDKSKNRYSIREEFFNENFCYSLDAKKKGNIGRYLNHSCEPNCFVQNVFVDSHDLRFPWVSFFATKDILAYDELTWDYNYEIGSIPGRKMPCYCGAHRCKKRLL